MDKKTAYALTDDLHKLCEKYSLPHHFKVMADKGDCIEFVFQTNDDNIDFREWAGCNGCLCRNCNDYENCRFAPDLGEAQMGDIQ